MRRVLFPVALLLAACSTAAPPDRRERDPHPAPAARRPATRPAATSDAPPMAERPYGTVELDEHDTPLASVLDRIADAADRPIVASVSSATLVTLTLHAAPWRDALDLLVRRHHLVRRDSGRMILLHEPPHNRLEASGATASSWFLLLARQGGFSIILPGNLNGPVDASLSDVTYEDALRATAREQGLEIVPVR